MNIRNALRRVDGSRPTRPEDERAEEHNMDAKTILKLISAQDYAEMKRLALAELSEKNAKTATEKTCMRAIVQLSKQAAKNKTCPIIAGAYYDDNLICITNGAHGIVTEREVSGCVFAPTVGSIFHLKEFILNNCPPSQKFKKIDTGAVANVKAFFSAAKANGDKRKQIVKIDDAFFDFTFFDSVFKCFIDPVFAVSKNATRALIFKDEVSLGIILPVRIFDENEIDKRLLITEL